MQGMEDTTGVINLTASAPGFVSGFLAEDLIQPSVRIANSLSGTIDTIDPPDEFYVRVGVANTVNFFVQDVRPGSPGVTVTAAVDSPLVAELVTLTDTSDVVTVLVPALEFNSALSVADGGVAFNGLSPGVATVEVTAPGFKNTLSGTRTVTVVAPTLTVNPLSKTGAGLMAIQSSVSLSASSHGGVTVHIESLNPDIALISGCRVKPWADRYRCSGR